MRRAIALTITALTAACGGNKPITTEEARGAMPSAAQAQIGAPSLSGQALTAAPAVGDAAVALSTAEYASDTIALALAVNGGVAWTLAIVELVVQFPPTTCAGDTCTWGPGSNAFEVNDWELTVTKKEEKDYVWKLAGRPKTDPGAAFITLVSGEAFTTGVRHVGHGTLLIDFDGALGLARKTADPPPQVGKISATYDNTNGGKVSAQFLGTREALAPDQRVNAAYQFSADASGGDLQAATRNLSTNVQLTLHSRWTGTGAGRGDASFAFALGTFSRSQCWDGASTLFNEVYQVTSPSDPGSDMGSESACAFAPAAPPTITVP
jgi:hypothetical protein